MADLDGDPISWTLARTAARLEEALDRIEALEGEVALLRMQVEARPEGPPSARRGSPWHRRLTRYERAVQQAQDRGKRWALEPEEYEELTAQRCYYCGGLTGGGVGLDRIDNARGYEPGNVLPCCGSCNMLRSNRLTVEETIAAVDAIGRMRAHRTPRTEQEQGIDPANLAALDRQKMRGYFPSDDLVDP